MTKTIEAIGSAATRNESRIAHSSRRALRAALEMVYPPECVNCEAALDEVSADGVLLCQVCRESFVPPDIVWCRRCGAPASVAESGDCQNCRRRRFAFDSVHVLGLYQGALRVAILKMKRYHRYALRASVAKLLADRLQPCIVADEIDLVVPVPMHWTRRLVRGTNSPETLARRIARGFARPVCCDLMRRNRLTRIQANLRPAERRSNVRGAFSMSRGSEVRGARILLVDDVLTTGATCHEVSRTLRAAGALQVSVAVVARTPGSES